MNVPRLNVQRVAAPGVAGSTITTLPSEPSTQRVGDGQAASTEKPDPRSRAVTVGVAGTPGSNVASPPTASITTQTEMVGQDSRVPGPASMATAVRPAGAAGLKVSPMPKESRAVHCVL